ncbi:hypothetical protein PIB30_089380 [Stylosanthes scabra]|uniref:Uncharacterized protein n=1 Tax=Stylosanthes scabra TaxID=79078 RepID=A0ABU6VT37_9FABA|nr:hypothetical protein [Stylosanthes scabra]
MGNLHTICSYRKREVWNKGSSIEAKKFLCFDDPLPPIVATTVTAKRSVFLAAALIEISPQKMPFAEIQLHHILLNEIIGIIYYAPLISPSKHYILLYLII